MAEEDILYRGIKKQQNIRQEFPLSKESPSPIEPSSGTREIGTGDRSLLLLSQTQA